MQDRDEWSFGDEPSGAVCAVCGKRNRSGQVRCAWCGAHLDEPDEAPLRTIGEAMAGSRPRRSERRLLAPLFLFALVVSAAGAYWMGTPHGRHLTVDPAALATVSGDVRWPASRRTVAPAAPAARATVRTLATAPPPGGVRAAVPPPAAVAPPAREEHRAPAVATPLARLAATARPQASPVPRIGAAPVDRPPPVPGREEPVAPPAANRATLPVPAPGDEAAPPAVAPPARPPASEQRPFDDKPVFQDRPSLGTDLVEARRAYTAAIAAYNARADEFNALADEYQELDPSGDREEIARLRVRLDQARARAEAARAEAGRLRARLAEVESRYR